MGRVMPDMAFRSSTLPPMILRSTFLRATSQLAKGVMSTSTDAITVGLLGVVFGLEYLTRALIAGTTLMNWREMFLRGRIMSLAA